MNKNNTNDTLETVCTRSLANLVAAEKTNDRVLNFDIVV